MSYDQITSFQPQSQYHSKLSLACTPKELLISVMSYYVDKDYPAGPKIQY